MLKGKITISADKYKKFLAAKMELEALEGLGIDNWIGWGQAQQEFIQQYVESHPLFLSHVRGTTNMDSYTLDDIDIDTIAEYETEMLLELLEELNAST